MRAPQRTERTEDRRRGGGSPQSNWRARCRALALALLLSGPVLASGGCGPLLFVPSAFTPQKVELIYSVQEDITLVRWRISSSDPADPDLSFEILDETGAYQPLDFSRSAYPGGGARCGDGVGSCFQYVLRGGFDAQATLPPVRAVHNPEGVRPGERASLRSVDTTLGLASFFHTGNDLVYVNLTDSVGSDDLYVFPRPYERTMWPTKGLCVSGSPPDGVEFSPLDASGGFQPPPLNDDGIYCVGVRPVANDGVPGTLAQTRVATLPETASVHVAYTPPIERSPIIYQIILDLQIVTDRCASAISKIENAVASAMNSAGVSVTPLLPINLAVGVDATGQPSACVQPASPAIEADQLAEAIKQTVSSHPETNAQVHIFYFNNLNAPLPGSLTSSLQTLFDDLQTSPPGHELKVLSWLFTPNPQLATLMGPTWWMSQPWQSADDPALQQVLTSYAQVNLPYTSEIHDPAVPVAYFTPDQVTSYAGGMFKVCNSNVFLQTVGVNDSARLGGGPSWPIQTADPPGYLVSLPTQIGASATSFVPVGVDADLQVCMRYCTGHPYVSTSGGGVTSWSDSSFCAETE